MINAILYSILLIILLLFFISKKRNSLLITLYAFYVIVSITSIVAINLGVLNADNLTLLPYLFLILGYIIYTYPLIKSGHELSNKKIDSNNKNIDKYKLFCYLYILTSIITIVCFAGPVLTIMRQGNWSEIRQMLYRDEIIYPYSNIIEHLCMIFSSYFMILAIIVGFIMLKRGENNKLSYVTIFSAIIAEVLKALYTSSRSSIFFLLMLVYVIYIFILKGTNAVRNKLFITLAILGVIFVVPYVIDITSSRFKDNEGIAESIIRYYGEPPIVFNKNVWTMKNYSYGKFAFSNLLDIDYDQSEYGGSWGTEFYTFIGFVFIDWGPIGVIIIGIISALIINKIIQKKKYQVSDLYLMMSYYYILLKGGLVIGRSVIITIISTAMIYLLIKIFVEKLVIKKKKALKYE